MKQDELFALFSSYPRFADGRIDFTESPLAAAVHVLLRVDDQVLLVQRSTAVQSFPLFWSGVTGYLDEPVSLQEKASEELEEELGLTGITIQFLEHPLIVSSSRQKIISFLGSAVLSSKPVIVLNEENVSYAWVDFTSISSYQTIPFFDEVVRRLFPDVIKKKLL